MNTATAHALKIAYAVCVHMCTMSKKKIIRVKRRLLKKLFFTLYKSVFLIFKVSLFIFVITKESPKSKKTPH